jgi:thiamine-phosphate pyrophosphorylase
MDFCLYLITDRNKTAGGRSLEDVLRSALDAGVKGVLLREKDLPDRALLALALRVRDLTDRYKARLLISERVDVALAVDAAGVHISGRSLPVAAARKLMGVEKYVCASVHSVEEALQAEGEGADFITFGPVYQTPSKAAYGPPVGLSSLEEACRRLKIPVFALGGVKEGNAVDTLKAGAFGVAVISGIIGADDPALAASSIMAKIRSFKMRKLI